MTNINELLYMSHQKDQYSLEALFSHYRGLIKYIVIESVKANQSLEMFKEDLEQEAWISFWQCIDSYREDRKACFTTFIVVVIKRRLYQIMKRLKRVENASGFEVLSIDYPLLGEKDFYEIIPQPNQMYEPEYYTNYHLAKERLSQLTDQLSVKEKEIYASWSDGESYKEAAERLKISPKTYDGRKQNLKRKIKQIIFE